MITRALRFSFCGQRLSFNRRMAQVQLSLLCIAALCLLVPCLALTQEEAKAIIYKNSGESVGEAKAQTSVIVRASLASATTPLQKQCIKEKIPVAFINAKLKVKLATGEIIKYGIENWNNVATVDAALVDQVVRENLGKVVASTVAENQALLKECLKA